MRNLKICPNSLNKVLLSAKPLAGFLSLKLASSGSLDMLVSRKKHGKSEKYSTEAPCANGTRGKWTIQTPESRKSLKQHSGIFYDGGHGEV